MIPKVCSCCLTPLGRRDKLRWQMAIRKHKEHICKHENFIYTATIWTTFIHGTRKLIREDFQIYFSLLTNLQVIQLSVHIGIALFFGILFKKTVTMNYEGNMAFFDFVTLTLCSLAVPYLEEQFPWWQNAHIEEALKADDQLEEADMVQPLDIKAIGGVQEQFKYLEALVIIAFLLVSGYLFEFVPIKNDNCKKTDLKQETNRKESRSSLNDEPPLDWFWHACLYGHKKQLRKIYEKHHENIDINQCKFKGNAAIHLAIWSGHIDTIRALLSRFAQDLDWSKRNDYGHNPLDLALMKKNEMIIKIVAKHAELEMSSLMFAMINRQHHHVSAFLKQLKNQIMEKDRFLPVFIQRFIEISRELELKKISKERREACNRNLNIIEKTCCGKILILFYPNSKTVLDIRQKVDLENMTQEESNEPSNEDPDLKEENTSKVPGIDEVFEEFSCPICCFLMQPPERRIYGCSNDHWICSICITDPKIKSCPSCREDFNVTIPKVRTTSERCLALLLEKFKYNEDE